MAFGVTSGKQLMMGVFANVFDVAIDYKIKLIWK